MNEPIVAEGVNVTVLVELCEALQRKLDLVDAELQEMEAGQRSLAQAAAPLLEASRRLSAAVRAPGVPANAAAQLAPVLEAAARLGTVVHQTVSRPRPFVGRNAQQLVPVAQVFAAASLEVAQSSTSCQLDLQVPGGCVVRTVPHLFRHLVVRLLTNAARHAPCGSPILVSAEDLEHGLRIEVVDRNPGVPFSLVEPLITLGRRDATSSELAGVDLDFYLVRGLTRALGGTAELRSRAGGGTEVVVTLPQRREADARRRSEGLASRPARSTPLPS